MSASRPMIELRNLHRHFGSTRAVDDVSFTVRQGQVFGYIGPNGAGKTTSMRVLATLDLPTAGDAMIDGFSVVDDPDRVRRRLGFMPDYFTTYANVNVREYLDFFARAYQLRGPQRIDAIDRVMSFTGLDVLAEKPIDGLSKGMKQRLCLGRALVHDPAVMVLDEPAAGLDPRARIELREMIRTLANGGQDDPHQLAHPHRAGRHLRRGGHPRARAAAGRGDGGRDPAAGPAAAQLRGSPPPGRRRGAGRVARPPARRRAVAGQRRGRHASFMPATPRPRPPCCGPSSRPVSASSPSARSGRRSKTSSCKSPRGWCNERSRPSRRFWPPWWRRLPPRARLPRSAGC